jgi:hypothetical protein
VLAPSPSASIAASRGLPSGLRDAKAPFAPAAAQIGNAVNMNDTKLALGFLGLLVLVSAAMLVLRIFPGLLQ